MNKVYACIDGLKTTTAVIDWAAWSANHLSAPLELLHVLERDADSTAVTDFSGAIGLGAQEMLLQQLSDLDAQRGKVTIPRQSRGHSGCEPLKAAVRGR